MLIRENSSGTDGILQYSNMVSMPPTRQVNFNMKLDMYLQLQGAVSPTVCSRIFLPSSVPFVNMLTGFLKTSQKKTYAIDAYFWLAFKALPSFFQTNTRKKKKKKGKMTHDLVSLLVNHKRPLLSTDVT